MRYPTHNLRLRSGLVAGLLMAAALTGCDFLDPTSVENPQTTAADLAQAERPTEALLPGLRAQFARVMSSNAVLTAVVSDDYSVHGTGLDGSLDDPRFIVSAIVNSTSSATGAYWNLQELRALADFVLDEIGATDDTATPAQQAEARYYRGMAYLMLAENFVGAPLERDAAPVGAAELLDRANTDFQASLQTAGSGNFATASRAALARTARWLGNAGNARQFAAAALGDDPEFLVLREFDQSAFDNGPWIFIVTRALKEMQPLPRLDFLDPKYTNREQGIAVAKAEEMHLILAEADMAQGNYAEGRAHLVAALRLALSRPTEEFNDNDARQNGDLTTRPRDGEIMIRADADSPYRAGLVLTRPGLLTTPLVSGTSLNPDSIAALPASDTEGLWHALFLARQEILFLEARRMADLGIRLPLMLREVDANASIPLEDPVYTRAQVPAYIPPSNEMDLFTPARPYDGEVLVDTQITMLHDLNRILARNGASPFMN
ncbi:MAG: hypothetical protein WEA09_10960 [Gemmatimonadota bacterium]